jgi:hypothetical protein
MRTLFLSSRFYLRGVRRVSEYKTVLEVKLTLSDGSVYTREFVYDYEGAPDVSDAMQDIGDWLDEERP